MLVYEDELICDLAETYGIYDYRVMPALLVATLMLGLRPDSRLALARSDSQATFEQTLMALQTDYLAILAWQNTEDSRHGRNRPKSITEKLAQKKTVEFKTPEELEKARRDIIRRAQHGRK